MKRVSTIAVLAVTILSAIAVINVNASVRQVSVYGIVDRVVFEPNERAPQRIKVWGAFAFLYANQAPVTGGGYQGDVPYTPHRGYIYFKLPATGQAVALKEWSDLKALAGTRQPITFGSWTSGWLGLPSDSQKLPMAQRRNGFVSTANSKESLRVYTEEEGPVSPITYTMDTGIVKLSSTGRHAVLVKQLEAMLVP
jgi:hypothetical protein